MSASLRRFVVVGQTASASGDLFLEDVPGTSGRLDVLIRSVRAAMLTSHEVRRDTVLDLVLRGGERAPRVLRIDGATIKFLRPDERQLSILVSRTLAYRDDDDAPSFVEVRKGQLLARGGLSVSLAAASGPLFVLDEGGADLRRAPDLEAGTFVLGDHRGFADDDKALLAARGARPVSVGPVSLHTEDVLTLVHNELDRRAVRPSGAG